ncbi:hypothetical protein FFLO_03129 [Filobasidium floriforme]|uniref:3-oxo-5-alpha-steroid 4-dehydrogenase C-terminal domain-containing protein n=1 Tax=Filobasidium floriforme TaxID=5210 RepID=A0A8K0JM13_9TREE|nr:3-oxo-5-alpha-steroid 4-dehydrogenase-domain-containing protein [Filobasidium floriforme]KAG7549016.1 hypothetical protein FFLO_03129 [Filobasidium floriforme]KAH8089761.1 3-oxo-5-alpha-steroid 4-dehydrogenase-domain-containing protein [Filobasidium floriforme]
MVSVSVKAPGKPATQVDFPGKTAEQVTVLDLKKAIRARGIKIAELRQRLSLPDAADPKARPAVLSEDTHSLAKYGIKESGSEVRCKDLGPQIAWRTVFLAEYFGPIVIQPLLYHLSTKGHTLYGALHKAGLSFLEATPAYEPSTLQKTVLALIVLHYVKREYETVFVHKFSHATMPFRNIFKNCSHYWLLCGVMTAASFFRPQYGAAAVKGTVFDNPIWIGAWSLLWVYGEFSNYLTHMNLRSIRTPPGQPRNFPKGYGFDQVTCANYWFESLTWIALTAMTCDGSFALFTAVSVGQMLQWALKKHKTYRKEHGKNYPKRNIMIPYIW